MSSKHSDCTQCQEWELCPFHPAEPASRAAPAAVERGPVYDGVCDWATDPNCGCLVCSIARQGGGAPVTPAPLASHATVARRLAAVRAGTAPIPPEWVCLGPDDPAVSTDTIYKTPAGTVVGVPAAIAAMASEPARASRKTRLAIGGVPFACEDFDSAQVIYTDYGGEFSITVEPYSDHERKLHAIYNAAKRAVSTRFVAIDARSQFDFATERAVFLTRRVHPCNPTIEYVLRFFTEVPS